MYGDTSLVSDMYTRYLTWLPQQKSKYPRNCQQIYNKTETNAETANDY